MSNRQIEQALFSLMPTQSTDLPPSLIQLAASLFAQSRNLPQKADEEVARLYACAHLACERLKIPLDLPPIAPRPPVPPRTYNRLYNYLARAIATSSANDRSNNGQTRTPNSKARDVGSSPFYQQRPVPSRGTPTKEQSLAQFRTMSKADPQTPTKAAARTPNGSQKNTLPPWVKPLGRYLCAETNNQRLAPSILAGMETILMPGGRATTDEWATQNTTALFAAIYFFVTMRVLAMTSGVEMDHDSYVPQRQAIIALLDRAREELTVKAESDEEAWAGWKKVESKDFDAAVDQVNERGWLQDDWFKGIDDIVNAPSNELLDAANDGGPDTADVQIRRADTMLQDKYDLLSEKRQAEYEEWKHNIMSRIDSLLAKNGPMDVDG